MKRILGILATVVAVSALIWVILESREGRYSSYASQSETPAPQQSAGASLTYNFDAVDAMPVKFHSARTKPRIRRSFNANRRISTILASSSTTSNRTVYGSFISWLDA